MIHNRTECTLAKLQQHVRIDILFLAALQEGIGDVHGLQELSYDDAMIVATQGSRRREELVARSTSLARPI